MFVHSSTTVAIILTLCLDPPQPAIDISQLPPSLHTIELEFIDMVGRNDIAASGPNGLHVPSLRTLILGNFYVSDPTKTKHFWEAHPGIERLELGLVGRGQNSWFDGFRSGMLPNLKHLKVI